MKEIAANFTLMLPCNRNFKSFFKSIDLSRFTDLIKVTSIKSQLTDALNRLVQSVGYSQKYTGRLA